MDENGYLKRTINRGRLVTGKTPSPEDIALELARFSPSERIDRVEAVQMELRGSGELSIEEALELQAYAGPILDMHDYCRKADR